MGTKSNPSLYEINFTEHLSNSVVQDGRVIKIVPQSSMTGKRKEERATKINILKHHTQEGVITLKKTLFIVLVRIHVLQFLLQAYHTILIKK